MWFIFPHRLRVYAFGASLAMVVAGAIWMESMGLTGDNAPKGIVSLEFAGGRERAGEVLEGWRRRFGSLDPAFNNLLVDDIVYIPGYATALGLFCLWAANVLGRNRGKAADAASWLYRAGVLLAVGQTVAGVLDYAENQSMRVMLRGPVSDPWPQITAWLASLKFGLVILGILFGLLGVAAWLWQRVSASSGSEAK